MEEIWRDIKEYEGLYQVSNIGRVKSLFRYKKILKLYKDKDGYLYVKLYKNKKAQHSFVHRLVAEAFVENLYSKPIVNHKDFNRENNIIDNLEWCTEKENINYSSNIGRYANKHKKRVCQYDKDGNFMKQWNSLTEASNKLCIPISNISKCCLGQRNVAGGYIWK